MLIIDTHAHIYSPDEKKYPPLPKPYRPPGGKGSTEDLAKEIKAAGVRAVCAIQTQTFYGFDNRYVCDSARANPSWMIGVCNLNPDDPKSPDVLRALARDCAIRGYRSIPSPRSKQLDDASVRRMWRAAAELGIVVNVLINRENAAGLGKLLGEFPTLRVVLDHSMNIKAGPDMKAIVNDVLRLARFKNLRAKLTFIPTGSTTGYPCADMHEACLEVIQAYGAERCVWGSDFPCELWCPKVTYQEHLRIFQKDLPLKEDQRAQILGGTAKKLWFPAL
ncbi:MAG: amidohydrolase [Bryobacterales bacterium]|nr:amidohydrolase [Bryobacterales bacterium]